MPKFEVSFTVETDDPLDEWANEYTPGSFVQFSSYATAWGYNIPSTAVVKRVVPPFEYGYWRHKRAGSVYKIVEDGVLKGAIDRNPEEWERVSVEAL